VWNDCYSSSSESHSFKDELLSGEEDKEDAQGQETKVSDSLAFENYEHGEVLEIGAGQTTVATPVQTQQSLEVLGDLLAMQIEQFEHRKNMNSELEGK